MLLTYFSHPHCRLSQVEPSQRIHVQRRLCQETHVLRAELLSMQPLTPSNLDEYLRVERRMKAFSEATSLNTLILTLVQMFWAKSNVPTLLQHVGSQVLNTCSREEQSSFFSKAFMCLNPRSFRKCVEYFLISANLPMNSECWVALSWYSLLECRVRFALSQSGGSIVQQVLDQLEKLNLEMTYVSYLALRDARQIFFCYSSLQSRNVFPSSLLPAACDAQCVC